MGSCCVKSKDVKELEDELGTLLNEKKKLEEKIEKQEQVAKGKYSPLIPEVYKFIDYDQYTSLKIIEILYSILTGDNETLHGLSQKVQSLSKFEEEQKLIHYGDVRKEETDLQKKLVVSCQENFKNLQDLVHKKLQKIESRVEKVQSLLNTSKVFTSERKSVSDKLLSLKKSSKPDFSTTISNLKILEDIEEELTSFEKALPGLHDDFIMFKLKDLENLLTSLAKVSLVTTQGLEILFGELKIPENLDVVALKVVDIDRTNFELTFTSIEKCIRNLQALETFKSQVLENNSINEKLESIDRTLTKHFLHSEQSKETAYSRINRVSRSQSDFTFSSHLEYLQYELSQKSVPATIAILKQKAKKYLKSLEQQDQNLLEMTEKFNLIDKIIDEIELKFQEFMTFEIKELYKWIGNGEKHVKEQLDQLSEFFIQYEEIKSQQDLIARLSEFLKRFQTTDTLNSIKSSLKETYMKELVRVKTELHEKENHFKNELSESKNQLILLESSFQSTKIQLSKTKELTEDLLRQSSEKELESTLLRNEINSLKESFDQVVQEKNQFQEEVEDLRKSLKDCKKSLRQKKKELSELQNSST
jgi:hypothetical protein